MFLFLMTINFEGLPLNANVGHCHFFKLRFLVCLKRNVAFSDADQ